MGVETINKRLKLVAQSRKRCAQIVRQIACHLPQVCYQSRYTVEHGVEGNRNAIELIVCLADSRAVA